MLKEIFSLIGETFSEWNSHNASRLAAALSYFTLFSLAPLLVVVIALAGLFFGADAARGQIHSEIDGLVGEQGAQAVEAMVQSAGQRQMSGIVATVVGVATLLFGAVGVFGQLYDSLNTVWDVRPAQRGPLAMLQRYLLSFTMVLGIGFLLLVSLVISAGLSALGEFTRGLLPGQEVLLQAINFIVSLAVITLLFAMLFKFVPEARVGWRDVWVGAGVTALLFTIGKLLIGLYLGQSSLASTYGAAGSLVLIMVWVYYSAQIMFLGAAFTKVYARRYGVRIVPEADAIATAAAQPALLGERRPQDAGPFAAAFLAFTTFVVGVFLGLVRGAREKQA